MRLEPNSAYGIPAGGDGWEALWFRSADGSGPYQIGLATDMHGRVGHAFVSYDERLTARIVEDLGLA